MREKATKKRQSRRARRLGATHLPGASSRRRRELAWIFALFFVAGVPALGTPVPFTTQPALTNGAGGARFVVAADLDGDGDPDALAAARQDNAVVWLENVNRDASSWVESTITTSAGGASSVFAADVDGDGDLDALSSSRVDQDIEWYENILGDGSTWALYTIADSVPFALSVYAADMDGDGDTDVLAGGAPGITLYQNESGSGTSWAAQTISTAVLNVPAVVAADVDGDGDQDVLTASYSGDSIDWLENLLGDASTWVRHSIGTIADGPYSVHAADVDGDGDVDAISASYLDDRIAWYENLDSEGSSWADHTIPDSADGPLSSFPADVDGDGDIDALDASFLDGEIAWHENLGEGASWAQHTITDSAEGAYSVFAIDLDLDGDIDVLHASVDDDEVGWHENRSIHSSALYEDYALVATDVGDACCTIVADVDDDPDLEVVADSVTGDLDWYHFVLGAWQSNPISTTVDDPSWVFSGDMNRDGNNDLVLGSNEGAFWLDNVLGDFSSLPEYAIDIDVGALRCFPTDAGHDGDTDVVCDCDEHGVCLSENLNGDGTSWDTDTIATVAGGVAALAVGNLDANPGDEVVVADASSGDIDWFQLQTEGPTVFSNITTTAAETSWLFVEDVNRDGANDVGRVSNGGVFLHRNGGNGSSWTDYTIDIDAGALRCIPFDADRDGDIDVVAAPCHGTRFCWYELIGTDLWQRHTVADSAVGDCSVVAADLGSSGTPGPDGRPDLVSTCEDGIRVYPNGGGQYALMTTALAQGVLANGQRAVTLEIELEHRGREGDSNVGLEGFELRIEDGAGNALTTEQANALIADLELFLDDGSGSFEPTADTLVEEVAPLTLSAGVQSIELAGGDPDVEVAFGESKRYFVAVTLTADASAQTPDSFEIFHLTESGSSARDASTPAPPFTPVVPLRIEHHPDTTTGLVDTDLSSETCKAPFELQLESFLVTTTLICEAGTTLRAGVGLAVTATGDLTLRAGQRIRFVTDFSVQPGGALAAEVDPSLQP